MIKDDNSGMDISFGELIGCSATEIRGYFGEILFNYPNLSVYKCGSGLLVVVFALGKAKEYAVYDSFGDIVYSSTKIISIADEMISSFQGKPMSDFITEFGYPLTDIGSGASVFAYLGNTPCVFMIKTINANINHITRLDFCESHS